MTVDSTGNTTMTQGKMRGPAKENAIAPNCYAIRAAGQTLKCRCRRRDRCNDREPYKDGRNKTVLSLPP